jgi:hypothetical protein
MCLAEALLRVPDTKTIDDLIEDKIDKFAPPIFIVVFARLIDGFPRRHSFPCCIERAIQRGSDPYRIACMGALYGLVGITSVIFAAPFESIVLFAIGVGFIGFGSGLFAHSTLTTAMRLAPPGQIGLALGVWGAVQATASGGAIAISGVLRDTVNKAALGGHLGDALNGLATGYGFVYTIEIVLLFATLIAIGPLVRHAKRDSNVSTGGTAPADLHFKPLKAEEGQ